MKFGNSVADIFIIKHTQFGWDAFGLDNSTIHCLWIQIFGGHSVQLGGVRLHSQQLSSSRWLPWWHGEIAVNWGNCSFICLATFLRLSNCVYVNEMPEVVGRKTLLKPTRIYHLQMSTTLWNQSETPTCHWPPICNWKLVGLYIIARRTALSMLGISLTNLTHRRATKNARFPLSSSAIVTSSSSSTYTFLESPMLNVYIILPVHPVDYTSSS